MTRPLLFALGLALISPVASRPAAPEDPVLEIAMGPSLEIGRRDLLFASVSSVCEDEKGDFYVLDRMEFKVHRFSAAGRPMKRSPIMAVVVLIAIAVIITLAGVASRDGGLQGSQNETGTFKLLPITTTTTS